MAHYIPNILTDYISGGSRSSGPWGSTIHMRDIISQLDTYNNPDNPINLNFYSKSSQTIAQLTHTQNIMIMDVPRIATDIFLEAIVTLQKSIVMTTTF